MAEENRFLRCVQEFRQEQYREPQHSVPYDPENRFERAVAEHKGYTRPLHRQSYDSENRFECLRDSQNHTGNDWLPRPLHRQSCSESEMHSPSRQTEQRKQFYSEYDARAQPKKPRSLTIDDTEQFPSLPSSPGSLGPKTPKTPKTPLITPLREEFEFIPLPKSQSSDTISLSLYRGSTVLSEQNQSHQQQYYQVVKKVTGGSWSDRLKLSLEMQKQQEEEDIEDLEYDEDGFPVLQSIREMVS